jgi:ribosomal protein S18 acetylase RimI-like enzyme
MAEIRILDVTDRSGFERIPPCADPGFDHRSCDYWEDADHGSKAARLAWLEASRGPAPARPSPAATSNPFLADLEEGTAFNPFGSGGGSGVAANPFARDAGADPDDNPFAPRRAARPTVGDDAPPKLRLLGRGLGVFGSYAKVLLADDVPVAYAQFGPLTAYPRAQRVRDLYPQLPDAPLPAVITCIATTREARHQGHALELVEAVVEDLAERGFTAIETYPVEGAPPDATSAATPAFWLRAGFALAVDDERFPVMRRELD